MRKRVGSTRGRVLPVWTLACARNGVPAVKIFVQERGAMLATQPRRGAAARWLLRRVSAS